MMWWKKHKLNSSCWYHS